METLKSIASILKKEKKITLISHVLPDGDAIGSLLALGMALKSMGCKVFMVNPDGVPKIYHFLPGSDSVSKRIDSIPSTVVLLDCSDLDRIGELKDAVSSANCLINIDHHVSNELFGHINYVDTEASATGEIIYSLLTLLNVEIEARIACSLYTAIVTDTGSFQFENTTSRTHLIAAELLTSGTDLSEIRRNLWENVPLMSIKLLTQTLKTLELDADGRIAWVKLPYNIFSKFGASTEHVEGIVNYPKSIEGVEIGLLFKEIEPGIIKVGLRSKTEVDVNELAQVFGGGGHKRAAGCMLDLPLEEAVSKVVEEAKKYLV